MVHDRHALVTGGGSGIGLATARRLAAAGARVTVAGRRLEPLRAAVAEGAAEGLVVVDVTQEEATRAALAEAVGARGPALVLINSAGQAHSAPFDRTTAEEWRRMMEVNVIAPAMLARALLPAMIEARFGRIVNVASTAALKGYPYVSAYVAAKHAVLGLTRALALETARLGVTVNAVCPGFTDTDLVAGSVRRIVAKTGRTQDQARAELARGNPQGRLVTADEAADAIAYLCGPGAGAVTGVALPVAGGEIG